MLRFNSLAWILVFVAIFSLAGCKKNALDSSESGGTPQGDIIRVGEVGSMTGAQATFGTSTHQGIKLAFDQVNLAGGIKGKKLELISLDDQGKPDQAAMAVTKLITQDHVTAILGEVASSNSIAMAPVAQNNKIPMITPSSTNPKVTEYGDYIFRVCFIDPFQGTVMAKFALEHLKAKTAAVLRDVKSDYSVGLADFFSQTYKKGGGKILVDQSYSNGDLDFKSQLTAIRAQNPEIIFAPGYYNDIGLIARQARELGIKVPLLGGDGWDSPKLQEIGGHSIDNSYFSNHYSSENKDPHVQGFIAKFKDAYSVVPDGLAAMGFDAAMVLVDGMKRSKSFSTADIRDALAATKNFPGVTGKITIDEKRNATKSAVVIKIDNGEFKYQMTINP